MGELEYMRTLSKEGLQRFQLTLLNRFNNARRAFKEARQDLEKQRSSLRLIAQVIKERKLANVVEFPAAPVEQEPTQQRRPTARYREAR
jgi:hypothetical protein